MRKYMKHIKLYESFNNFDEDVKNLINWNLVEDIKDMSLDYIDNGLTLSIYIRALFNKHRQHWLYRIIFNHEKCFSQNVWEDNKFIEIEGYSNLRIEYGITLFLEETGQCIYDGQEKELVDRVKEAYPEELIVVE